MNEWLRTILFLPPQASSVAASIDHLHYFVILTTFFGAAGVGITAVYFTIRYRRREQSTPHRERPLTTPLWAEALIVSGIFGLFFTWWVIGYMQYLRMRVPPENTYDVYVTAKQWMWKFSYAEGQHTIAQLYVPAGRPVKLIMTSRDVIHSFYVPDFRVKQDVIPGRYTTVWFTVNKPGTHLIECAEYCGTSHSMMRAQVIALDETDFGRWLASAPLEPETPAPPREQPAVVGNLGPSAMMSLERLGVEVAAQEGCLRCHTLDGSPHIGPTWAGLYKGKVPLQGGGSAFADESYLTESMMDPLAKIHAGYQPVMPSYLGRLRPGETAAILALIKSLRDVAPTAPGAPPPSEQGLPPPGATPMPPMRGPVRVGPNGPTREQP
ncbi:MAG TPA: cytochrome c oxidase subunit II [Polyangia bacterium]|nr:cytochrome c oxidase subunit II [Polyangia bacterium]